MLPRGVLAAGLCGWLGGKKPPMPPPVSDMVGVSGGVCCCLGEKTSAGVSGIPPKGVPGVAAEEGGRLSETSCIMLC